MLESTISYSMNEDTISNNFLDSDFFVILTAIVIPIILWLISPQIIKNAIKDFFTRNKVNKDNLCEDIKKLHLGICNEQQLSIDEFVRKYRYVFFPVVPNKAPNVIHVTFINAIKGLEKLGLHVYVFIFDDYFCKVKMYGSKERKTYVTNFTKSLCKMGIKKKQVLLESKFVKKSFKAKRVVLTLYRIASKLSVAEANNLSVVNSHYINDNSKYIRKFKSILNMVYFNTISTKIGFVLSGEDECKLWETYTKEIDSNIVHLYINKLYTENGGLSNVLDTNILSCEDSFDAMKEKVSRILNDCNTYNINCSIFYLLEHNYFIYGKNISFEQQDGTVIRISTTSKLIEYCKKQLGKGKVEENTINAIAKTAHEIFHNK